MPVGSSGCSNAGGAPMRPLTIPPRFEILEKLGADSFSRLLRARDTLLEREVYLAYPTPNQTPKNNTPAIQHRLREARALARIDHPAVQRLIDVIDVPGGPLLV